MTPLEQAVSQLVARLAHDLKNPMAVVLSNLHYLQEEIKDTALLEAVEESLHAAERTTRMIDDVVDLTRLHTGRLPVTLAEVRLAEVEPELRSAVERMVGRRSLSIALPEATVLTDRALLARALINLLEHALRNSPSGSQVRLEGEAEQGVRLRLVDSGALFAPTAVPSILGDEMPSADPPPSGYRSDQGLGLYFAGSVIRALGGTVQLRERSDGVRGVVFELQLVKRGGS